MTAHPVLLASALALLIPPFALATGIDEKTLLSPYPGSNLISEKVTEFDDYDLVVGGIDSAKGACERKRPLQGRVARFYYENPKGRSHAEIFANYQQGVTKAGFQAIFTCREEACTSSAIAGQASATATITDPNFIGRMAFGPGSEIAASVVVASGSLSASSLLRTEDVSLTVTYRLP